MKEICNVLCIIFTAWRYASAVYAVFIPHYNDVGLYTSRMDSLLESLKDRHEMLMARFFKRQVLSINDYLLPEQRDNDTVRSPRNFT